MISTLLLINIAATLIIFAEGLTRRLGFFSYPFLVSCIYLTWFLPQAYALQGAYMDTYGFRILLWFSLLSLVGTRVGWEYRGKMVLAHGARGQQRTTELMSRRVLVAVLLVTLFAISMRLLIELRPASERAMSQWSGPLTILSFFASVSVVSLSASVYLFLLKKSAASIFLLCLNLGIYFPSLFIAFRRADIAEAAIAFLFGLYATRRVRVPKAVLLVGIVAGFFVLHGIGELRSLGGAYRATQNGEIERRLPTLSEIAEIDWTAAVRDSGSPEISETRNAIEFIEATRFEQPYLGASLWNRLVFQYVPGQFVGYEFKESLFIGQSIEQISREKLGFTKHPGSTETGFVDLYRDFGLAGFIFFIFQSIILKRYFNSFINGNFVGYLVYTSVMVSALHSFTHFGYYMIVNSLIYIFAILIIHYFSKKTAKRRKRNYAYRPS